MPPQAPIDLAGGCAKALAAIAAPGYLSSRLTVLPRIVAGFPAGAAVMARAVAAPSGNAVAQKMTWRR